MCRRRSQRTQFSKRLMQVWPESVKDKTRSWIADNVRQADLRDLQVAIRATPGTAPDVFLGFDFSGLETRFMKKMPVIKEASGRKAPVRTYQDLLRNSYDEARFAWVMRTQLALVDGQLVESE